MKNKSYIEDSTIYYAIYLVGNIYKLNICRKSTNGHYVDNRGNIIESLLQVYDDLNEAKYQFYKLLTQKADSLKATVEHLKQVTKENLNALENYSNQIIDNSQILERFLLDESNNKVIEEKKKAEEERKKQIVNVKAARTYLDFTNYYTPNYWNAAPFYYTDFKTTYR